MGQMDRDYWRVRYNRRTIGSVDPDHWRQDEIESVNRWSPLPRMARTATVPEVAPPEWNWLRLFLFFGCIVLALLLTKEWLVRRDLQRSAKTAVKTVPMPQHPPVLEPTVNRSPESQRAIALAEREEQRKAELRQRREEAEYMRRKEAAWERSYKPSPSCAQSATVECGNEYIRARRAFDASYKG